MASELTPQQRGALIRNSGDYPLAGRITPAEILARYEAGEKVVDIAHSLQVSRKAVYRHLLAHAPDQWREYQAAHALDQHQRAIDMVEAATDPLDIARAREGLRDAQWQLERLCKRLYGDSKESTGSGTININIGIQRDSTVTVERDESST